MKKSEAMKLLETAPRSSKPSRLNGALTEAQAVDIVTRGIASYADDAILDRLTEKRVNQVCQNRVYPK
jgi:hypothetical protein